MAFSNFEFLNSVDSTENEESKRMKLDEATGDSNEQKYDYFDLTLCKCKWQKLKEGFQIFKDNRSSIIIEQFVFFLTKF